MFKIALRASEKNIIEVLGQLKSTSHKRKNELENDYSYKQSRPYRCVVEKLNCLALVKGLKKSAIK